MSLKWASYVAPKSQKGAQKRKVTIFLYKKWIYLEESLLQSFFVYKLSAALL